MAMERRAGESENKIPIVKEMRNIRCAKITRSRRWFPRPAVPACSKGTDITTI